MLMHLSYMDGSARPAQTPDTCRDVSGSGVSVILSGWEPGFNKVRFTQVVRDGGLGLRDAMSITRRVLNHETVQLSLPAYTDRRSVVARLRDIGTHVQ